MRKIRNAVFELATCAAVMMTALLQAQEMLFFDMDRVITKADRGFPKGNIAPAGNNGDWSQPVNYLEGTVHVRVEARSTPKPFSLQPSWAIWMPGKDKNGKSREPVVPYSARPTMNFTPDPEDVSVKTASFSMSDWLYYNGASIDDFIEPRVTMGPVIKAGSASGGGFISDHSNFNWGGMDPDDVYPMDMRYSLVVVAPGSTFSGWDNYIGETVPEPGTAALLGIDCCCSCQWRVRSCRNVPREDKAPWVGTQRGLAYPTARRGCRRRSMLRHTGRFVD